ncbi:hypothetical protein [Streptomyces alanosinicus]|uniref:hypothetical protein n=1 Tax=Streptomyces alanosinicus TaxID=68171 RepID=UPI00167594A9|nr:hypothetical protein [Streptomyces alanosinicus]
MLAAVLRAAGFFSAEESVPFGQPATPATATTSAAPAIERTVLLLWLCDTICISWR